MKRTIGVKLAAFLCFAFFQSFEVLGQDIVYGQFDGASIHRLTTPSGYIDLGPKDANWAHIFTDRPKFLFNQPVYSSLGIFSSSGNTDLQLQTDGSTRMTILQNNGYVGIGTESPGAKLHVNRNATIGRWGQMDLSKAGLRVEDNSFSMYMDGNTLFTNGTMHIGSFGNYGFTIGTNDVERVKVAADGNVGIGTTNPESRLHAYKDATIGRWGNLTLDNAAVKIEDTGHSLYIDGNTLFTDGPMHMGSFGDNEFTIGTNDVERVKVAADGNVGIGTTNPESRLHAYKDATIGRWGNLTLDNAAVKIQDSGYSLYIDGNTLFTDGTMHIGSFGNYDFTIGTNDLERVKVTAGGNVGIGTDNPTEKLSVNGTIRSKEIICEVAPWPDYVFEAGYDLKPLSEIEQFIQEEGHLPNIPSAEEVEEEGIALAKMNALLLEKIEELTLHMIDQNNRIASQDQKLNGQQALIESLLETVQKQKN